MSAPRMTIDEQDGIHIAAFAEDINLDAVNLDAVRPELYALVESAQGGQVVLDLENVAFLSSDALGCLLAIRLKAVRADARLVLAGVREHLKAILNLTQLDQMFEVYATRAEALAQLAAG